MMIIICPHPLPFGLSIAPLRVEETLVVFLHGSEERCSISIRYTFVLSARATMYSAPDLSTAPTLAADEVRTARMAPDADRLGNRGFESSDSELGDQANGTAGQPQQTASTPEASLMETMQEMMKQQMEMFNRLLNSSTEKGLNKSREASQTIRESHRVEILLQDGSILWLGS